MTVNKYVNCNAVNVTKILKITVNKNVNALATFVDYPCFIR